MASCVIINIIELYDTFKNLNLIPKEVQSIKVQGRRRRKEGGRHCKRGRKGEKERGRWRGKEERDGVRKRERKGERKMEKVKEGGREKEME